jgi:hypothetical protein
MKNYLFSLLELVRRVIRNGYAVVVGIIGGAGGIASEIYGEMNPKSASLIPVWTWLTLLIAGTLIAVTSAFHEVRLERDLAITQRDDAIKDRDAMRTEIQRRFDALKYALKLDGVPAYIFKQQDRPSFLQVGVRFKNISRSEQVLYEMESISVIIETQTVGNPNFPNRGAAIAPGETDSFMFEPIRGFDFNWIEGFVKYTVKYGRPDEPLKFRKSQHLRIWPGEKDMTGEPGKRIYIRYVPIYDPPPEEIESRQPAATLCGIESCRTWSAMLSSQPQTKVVIR